MGEIDPSRQVDAFETRMRPRLLSNLLLWLILAFFIVALLWAWLTEVDKSVHATGRIIPSQQLQSISNLEGGIVDAIYVRTGQSVSAGAPLLRLSQTLSGAELGSGSATVAALTAKEARLRAQTMGRAPILTADPRFAGESALYQVQMAELGSIDRAGLARINAASSAVDEARSMLEARRSQANAAQSELAAIRPLVERGIEPQLSLTLAQGRAASAAGEAAAAAASVSRAMAAVAEARAARSQQLADWRSRSGMELTAAQAELAARRESLPALADRVRRTLVTSPVAGRINRVMVATTGSSVAPGSLLVEVVPSDDAPVVEVAVNPKDIASIHLGQDAQVSITAYDSAVYGRLGGKVVTISPDAINNDRTGESHYLVRIRIAQAGKGRHLAIGPGMMVEANLLGEKQTVLSYVLSPLTRMRNAAFRD